MKREFVSKELPSKPKGGCQGALITDKDTCVRHCIVVWAMLVDWMGEKKQDIDLFL